jgi:16S rRNA G527 N7-methylase RsmG
MCLSRKVTEMGEIESVPRDSLFGSVSAIQRKYNLNYARAFALQHDVMEHCESLRAENERLRERWKKLRQSVDAHVEAIDSHNGILDDQGVAFEVAFFQVIEDMEKLEQECEDGSIRGD